MIPSPDALLEQVRASAQGFHVFGELGRHDDRAVWYLAGEHNGATLVALRLRSEGSAADGAPRYSLEVTRELSSAVALGVGNCPHCAAAVRAWARFCGKCGGDLAGPATVPRDPAERNALLEQVRAAAGEVYDVLGEMPWAGGGGIVYFATERDSGRLVRLRLQHDADGMALGETRASVPLERLSATYVSQAALPAVPAEAVPGAAATPPNAGSAGQADDSERRPAPRRRAIFIAIAVIAGAILTALALT